MVLFTIILMDLLTGMEFDLFVPSFPQLQDFFHLTPFEVTLSLSVNFIAYCIGLFIVGELGDRHDRKSIILFGLLTFIAGNIFCLTTHSYYIFLWGRFLQGLGIAAPAILSFLILSDLYPVKKQQFLLAMLNGSLNTAAAFAPVIGSYITKYFHWEGNFFTLLFLGFIVFIMVGIVIPRLQAAPTKNGPILNEYGSILTSPLLVLLIVYFILCFIPYWIFVGISPLLYMKGFGVSLSHFGYYQGSFALIFAIGSVVFGFVMNKFDHKKMLIISNKICIFSVMTIALVTIINSHNPLFITLAFMPFIISQIIPGNILYPLYLQLRPESKGRLTSLIQGGRLIFSSIGLQIAAFFYDNSFLSVGIILATLILMGVFVMFIVLKHWASIEVNS